MEEEEQEEEEEDKEKQEEDEDTLRVLADSRVSSSVDWPVIWRFFEGSAILGNSGVWKKRN